MPEYCVEIWTVRCGTNEQINVPGMNVELSIATPISTTVPKATFAH